MDAILFKVPYDKVISKVHLYKDDDVVVCQSLNTYNELVASGYQVFEEPDPLFNPNEVTRVSEIMALHRKGVDASYIGSLRSSIRDTRTDEEKINSPNLESDKLFPSFAKLSTQNAHYAASLNGKANDLQQQANDIIERVELEKAVQPSNT